jgi:phospholipid transport system substrate-binding protein
VLKDQSIPVAQKNQNFTTLFTQNFDVPTIGRFVLGRYWRTATPQQQSEYIDLFGKYVVAVYSDRFSRYTGVTFKVSGEQQTAPAIFNVSSTILRNSGDPPIHVGWVVDDSSGSEKIVDVNVENVSMRIAQRDEFSSVIENNGGDVQALINVLKQKVQND